MKIVFYGGFQPGANIETYQQIPGCGGSEIALIYTAHELQKLGHQVSIYTFQYPKEKETIQNVDYGSVQDMMHQFQKEQIDAFIISRYVHGILFQWAWAAKKIFIWVHDVCFHPASFGPRLDAAKTVRQHWDYITNIVCVSQWQIHNLNSINGYSLQEKGIVIGNGLSQSLLENCEIETSKIPFSFIWCSHHARGLTNLIRMWPLLKTKIFSTFQINPSLTICGETIPENQIVLDEFLNNNDLITLLGKIPQSIMFEHMKKSHIWFYPTNFHETYCMVALECELAECICIAADIAALKETIGDRGTIYHPSLNDDQVTDLVIQTLQKEFSSQKQKQWALEQTWKQRALQWEKIMLC